MFKPMLTSRINKKRNANFVYCIVTRNKYVRTRSASTCRDYGSFSLFVETATSSVWWVVQSSCRGSVFKRSGCGSISLYGEASSPSTAITGHSSCMDLASTYGSFYPCRDSASSSIAVTGQFFVCRGNTSMQSNCVLISFYGKSTWILGVIFVMERQRLQAITDHFLCRGRLKWYLYSIIGNVLVHLLVEDRRTITRLHQGMRCLYKVTNGEAFYYRLEGPLIKKRGSTLQMNF